MHAVVGIDAAEPGEQGVALIACRRLGVLEDEQVGAVAYEDAAARVLAILAMVLFHGDAHGHREDPVGEDGHLVGLAVAVGVFEDLDLVGILDPVKSRIAAAAEPVVQPLGDPDPAAESMSILVGLTSIGSDAQSVACSPGPA